MLQCDEVTEQWPFRVNRVAALVSASEVKRTSRFEQTTLRANSGPERPHNRVNGT